jgi:hypothetical protein
MAQNANVEIVVSSKADTRGFKQAETALDKLNRSVKNVASALGLAYGARAIVNFGKASVKAFAADDKAAQVLTKSLDNLGLAFADLQVKDFIAGLEKTYAVLDDQLRPAFQRLLTTTGSVAQAQSILLTALNLSAASGVDLVTVSQDLSKAYVGQTRGLAKYGLGLSQAQLKAMSFLQLQKKVDSTFTGQAAIAADSYAGKLEKLNIAANNAKETVGKGLFEALNKIGGGGTTGIDNVTKSMNKLAQAASISVNVLADVFQAIANPSNFIKQNTTKPVYMGATPAIQAELKKAAIEKAAVKRAKEQAALTAKNTKAVKEQTALQKASALFDLDQIQLIAALKGKLSDEDRKRAELQLAILQENEGAASKLAGQVAKAQGLTADLVAYYSGLPDAKNPFSGWVTSIDEAREKAAQLLKGIDFPTISPTNPDGSLMFPDPFNTGDFLPANPNDKTPGGRYGNFPATPIPSGQTNVTVNVAGSVVSQGELVDAVRNGLLNSSLDGSGSTVNRLQGSFATL